MLKKDDPNLCRVKVTGPELVELKRHAHKIPECSGLDRRIQRYDGTGLLKLTRDELDWLVAVLDAILHNPKGYPCVEYDPFKVEYVPPTDERCVACQRLYERLNGEAERQYEATRKRLIEVKKRARTRERQKAEDLPRTQIESVFRKRKCPAIPIKVGHGYNIYYQDTAVGRIRERGRCWEVMWWSHRDKWESIGDMGGVLFDTVEEAATYVLDDPMGIFW
jgi:hypothetical protein